jgi:hypothetical protein
MKKYYIMCGVGKAKYVVNFHDGEKKHKDGGEFYDIRIFKNIKDLKAFTSDLRTQGYKCD